MKTFYTLLFFCVFSFTSITQTELIAYKSHSGDMDYFFAKSDDNLGLPPAQIDTIIILNDSTIIEISSMHFGPTRGFCQKDTVVNHPMYNNIDNYEILKGKYYDTSIVFINYDTLTVKQKKKIAKKKKKENSILPINNQNSNSNKKLLFFLSLFVLISFSLTYFFNKNKLNVS